jgi:TRAP-type C4-dicarboxylate transport system permease small subunit
MGDMYNYVIMIAVILIGAIATFMVGFSKENKEEGYEYEKKAGVHWIKLTWFYVISIVGCVLAVFFFLN